MTVYKFSDLEQKVKDGHASTCISTDGARIIVPTACDQVVGFTNPDDLSVDLLERWKKGERGPEFENQQLHPGDCLVMYNNGRNINELLAQRPGWHKTPEGIKEMITLLYSCADVGAKKSEPAIWNSDLGWAKSVRLMTTSGQEITDELWHKNAGVALEAVKTPVEQNFIRLNPGDVLISPKGIIQTAGATGMIAVKQPGDKIEWNIVQLGAKGYTVMRENMRGEVQGRRQGRKRLAGFLAARAEKLDEASEVERVMREVQAERLMTEAKEEQEKSGIYRDVRPEIQYFRAKEGRARAAKLGEILRAKYRSRKKQK